MFVLVIILSYFCVIWNGNPRECKENMMPFGPLGHEKKNLFYGRTDLTK